MDIFSWQHFYLINVPGIIAEVTEEPTENEQEFEPKQKSQTLKMNGEWESWKRSLVVPVQKSVLNSCELLRDLILGSNVPSISCQAELHVQAKGMLEARIQAHKRKEDRTKVVVDVETSSWKNNMYISNPFTFWILLTCPCVPNVREDVNRDADALCFHVQRNSLVLRRCWKVCPQEAENFDEEVKSLVSAWFIMGIHNESTTAPIFLLISLVRGIHWREILFPFMSRSLFSRRFTAAVCNTVQR